MPEAVLSLDQGTTGSTALVFSREGKIIGRAYSEFTQSYPQPGWVEHDPDEIFAVSLQVMTDALEVANIQPSELKAIGIANQRETTVVWDRDTGRPIHPAIVWQSRQTTDICQQLKKDGHEGMIRERTGLVIDPYFSGTKIKWILDRYPDARAKARDGKVVFGTIDTWLLWKLSGGVLATEPTNASRTLLYNIHERQWDQELLDLLDVPRGMLPEVKASCSVFAETCQRDRLPGGVPIAGIAGDQQAALYGQGCWSPGMAKNTYGTGSFVVMNMGALRPPVQPGLLTTICCDESGQPAYALEGSIFVAGAAIQWLRDELGLIVKASDTESIARSVPDTLGVHVVPAFTGLGAPHWDMDARGAILGLTRGAGRAHIVRATLESLAYQTCDVVDAMTACGADIRELRVDGGAAANEFLMQFQADLLGVPVDRPTILETTASGVAFLAGLSTGFWSSPEEIQSVRRRDRLFEPMLGSAEREQMLAGWKQALSRVRTN